MHAEFKVTLTDVNSGTPSIVTVPAIISDFYKYESTYGFPFANRVNRQYGSTANQEASYYGMSALFNSSAVKLFTSQLPTKKKRIRTNISNTYCGYAANRQSSASEAGFSTKYGYCTSYSTNVDRGTPDNTYFEVNWHFDANRGNGTIKALGTSAPIGIHSCDTEQILPLDTAQSIELGKDYSPYMCFPYGGACAPANSSTTTYQVNSADIDCSPLISMRGDLNDKDTIREWYYQTADKIIQLWSDSFNVFNENNEYVTEIKYRVINKKWMFQYCIGIDQGVHPLTMQDWINNPSAIYDGVLEINSGAYPLKNTALYDSNDQYKVAGESEEAFSVIFVAQAGQFGANPNPDALDKYLSDNGKMCRIKTFVISGASPMVTVFDSVYDSPLSAFVTDRAQVTSPIVARSKILFDKDFNYYYVRSGVDSSQQSYYYYAKRSLTEDTLQWYNKYNVGQLLCLNFTMASGSGIAAAYFTYDNTNNYLGNAVIIDKATGQSIEGYELSCLNTYSACGKPFNTLVLLKTLRESPFFLCPCASSEYNVIISTDFLYAKANLATEIVKTSNYVLDIQFKLYID